MKRHHIVVLTLGIVALVAAGCVDQSSHPISPAGASPSDQKHLPKVIDLPRRTLIFQPTRDDLTVGCAEVAVVSSHPVRVNGVEAKEWNYIYLKQVGRNQFELPALRIEFAPDGPEAIGCLSVKILFNEVTAQADSDLYEHRDDRYALLSWCTKAPELMKDTPYKARFGQNRVQTLDEFKEKLAKPFPLRMKPTPLKADWGYPATTGGARKLSEAELQAVKQIMRDRGEQYLISIVGGDATHANVKASIGDMTRYQGVRHYQLALKKGVWKVESVVEEPNVARLADR
jgi:hypothetical protein